MDKSKTLFNKGVAFINLNKYEEAIQCFDKVIELKHDDSAVYFNKGRALLNLNSFKEAISAFDKAIEINKKTSAYYYKGLALINLSKNTSKYWKRDRFTSVFSRFLLAHFFFINLFAK